MAAVSTVSARPLRAFVDETLTLFANILFAVSLFAVWAVLTLIGVIVEQGRDPDFYARNYAPAIARAILRLDVWNIYHSPAYIGIILLILASLAVCTFRRVIPARLPPLRAVKVEHIPLHAYVAVRGDEATVRARIERFFHEQGWHVRRREIGGVEWSFADRHNWARRGVLVAHVGFVIITAGTFVYWLTGFSGTTTILSGQTVTIPQTGARIALQRFGYRFDPIHTKSGLVYQPIDYVSHVRITGRDRVERDELIRVNHPIDVDGTLYYQASYGFGVTFALTRDGKPMSDATTPIREGDAIAIPGTSRSLQYAQFVGTIDRRSMAPAADPRPNDPGVVVDAFDGDQLVGRVLVPLGTSIDLGAGYRLAAQRYTVYTGLQYRYDPGIPLVGIGAFVLLAGLCISFYLLPARLYVRVDGEGSAWNVGIAATTVKGYDIFEERFRELIDALRRSDEPPRPDASRTATAPAPA